MYSEISTIQGRLKLERERLRLSQAAVYGRLVVSKGTYIKYESGETSPSARHLAVLADMGFDIYYIVVGERSANELGSELGNLIDAYTAASDELQAAALAVLMTQYNRDVAAARVIPRYFEEKVKALLENGSAERVPKANVAGSVGQIVQGDATFNGTTEISAGKPKRARSKKQE
ncbi:helix-turn-helix domain-containing protein [Thauera aromatica]|uniref:helix-turn-helix domain-containing protein n=1 Tax=Thauera aromatica TaxID=59405 RepID=UPI001FFCAAF7|nr:helix-turn-helix transcriptional regulator [Thauera aromatica]MCK2097751.1 helix-turn-helix domain-containing protein [Thauera aromatica]